MHSVNDSDALIFACIINQNGGAEFLDHEKLSLIWPQSKKTLWAHFNFQHSATRQWLEADSCIHSILVETLLADQSRPSSLIEDDGLLLSLKSVNYTQGAEPEDMASIRVWITANRIASFRSTSSRIIDDMRHQLALGKGIQLPGEFLVELLSGVTDRIHILMEDLEEELDTLEEETLNNHDTSCRVRLSTLRQQTVGLRKHLHPQRDVLLNLPHLKLSWLTPENRMELETIAQKQIRYVEELDYIRERSAILQEQINGYISESLVNKMYILALITCIFAPLHLMVGLWGANVGGIPGGEATNGFWGLLALLVLIALSMLFLLRKRRWF